jgi:Tfp pilus assembly protein PilN
VDPRPASPATSIDGKNLASNQGLLEISAAWKSSRPVSHWKLNLGSFQMKITNVPLHSIVYVKSDFKDRN